MEETKMSYKTIDEYILQAPAEVQEMLYTLRSVIKECIPEAEEKISYGMPTFALKGNVVYFAINKNHIGFYPTPSGISNFEQELSEYKTSKGAVQFSLDKPLPYDLIRKITKFRAAENLRVAEERVKSRKK